MSAPFDAKHPLAPELHSLEILKYPRTPRNVSMTLLHPAS